MAMHLLLSCHWTSEQNFMISRKFTVSHWIIEIPDVARNLVAVFFLLAKAAKRFGEILGRFRTMPLYVYHVFDTSWLVVTKSHTLT
jgi:hypothetical protein